MLESQGREVSALPVGDYHDCVIEVERLDQYGGKKSLGSWTIRRRKWLGIAFIAASPP